MRALSMRMHMVHEKVRIRHRPAGVAVIAKDGAYRSSNFYPKMFVLTCPAKLAMATMTVARTI